MNVSSLLPKRGADAASNLFEVVQRRFWSKPGKLHVELPDLDRDEYVDYTTTLRVELEELEGVYWARANGGTRRMVVAWDEAKIGRNRIMEVVEQLEDRYSIGEADYEDIRADHPGDDEPIIRAVARVAAAFVGAGTGVFMRLFGDDPGRFRSDLAAFMTVVDNVPHLREFVAEKLGPSQADTAIGLTNPIAQGIGSGPAGPSLDFIYQTSKLIEAAERRRGWIGSEAELAAQPEQVEAPLRPSRTRPVPIPEGPIEQYAEEAWHMSLGGFLVGLADTQELDRAITPLLDALPKPGRYGRDTFCGQLTGVLADRDMVVMNPEALRRLDRIDCAVVDGDLLITDRYRLDRIASGPTTDPVEAFERAEQLLDPLRPDVRQSEEGWELGPARQFDLEIDPGWTERLRSRGARGDLLLLARDGRPHAMFSLRVLADLASWQFVESIHEAGLELIIVTEQPETVEQFHPDRIKHCEGIDRFIRHIQKDYQVVGYFGNGPSPAMEVADCSVGFDLRDAGIAWSADILAGDDLDDATFMIDAMVEARDVSKKCATFAGAGAAVGALSAIQGLEETGPGRVMTAVNTASLIALGSGAYRARKMDHDVRPRARQRQPWHRLRVEDVFERLDSDFEGLGSDEARDRRPEPPEQLDERVRALRAVGRELANPLTPVLAGGAAVSAMVGSLTDAGIVGAVIAFNALVGGLERHSAEESIREMARRESIDIDVRRDGAWKTVEAEDLVVGDVIRLEHGEVVPADCRIVEARRLEVDESSLTGESMPVSKDPEPSFSPIPSDRTSMLYDGTAVVAGTTVAVVVATGEETEMRRTRWIGKRAEAAEGVEARLQGFSEKTLPYVSTAGGLLMALGVFRRRELKDLVGPAVNLAVGAVPEGLPLLATTAQLAAARRLSERNVVVQNPRAMEAIGRTDLLCLDKTGTLTEGTLQFHGIDDGDRLAEPGDFNDVHCEVFKTALRATPTASNGDVLPHATDQAIVDGATDHGVDVGDWSTEAEIPFRTELAIHVAFGLESDRKRMAVKGSPEAVINRCSGIATDGEWSNLTNGRRDELLERAEKLAGEGLRVLAVAGCRFRGEFQEEMDPEVAQGLTFYGFVTLSDPLRPKAREAVESLQAAGVSVLMLTGDHPETARRIAREVGLEIGSVLTGDDISQMEDDELAEALVDATVIARMTPSHKVRIVEAFQTGDRAVAMTGDGGNDAAAIRLADCGIALGSDCATAARDAADLVVSDARIETIVDAVVEGRGMWRSVRDAVSILIGGNLGEILFMLGSGLVNTLPALNARQLLLVNLFTDVAPALAIALRPPPEVSPEDLLHEGPEESLGESLERDIGLRAVTTGAAGFGSWLTARYTFQKKRASTVGLLSVVTAQLGQTLTSGKPSPEVWAAGLGSTAGLLAIIETPGLSHLFGSRPLGPVGLTTAMAGAGAATAASLIVPRLPEWKRQAFEVLPVREDPTPEEFFEEFWGNFPG